MKKKVDYPTGSPPGLLQDDSRELSKWFASRPGARRQVTELAREIGFTRTPPVRDAHDH